MRMGMAEGDVWSSPWDEAGSGAARIPYLPTGFNDAPEEEDE